MENEKVIHAVTFNHDGTCFVAASSAGFQVFSTDPFQPLIERKIVGGLRQAEMLYRTNILALLGTGENPTYPRNKVIMFDDARGANIGELNFHRETVIVGVRLRRDFIIVILLNRICVFSFDNLQLKHELFTCQNPQGLCSLNTCSDPAVLVCPAVSLGTVRVQFLASISSNVMVMAHQSAIDALSLNRVGSMFATSSVKGTLLRVWNVKGQILHEFRRGSEQARIESIRFDPTDRFLSCTSNSGTLHLFALDDDKKSLSSSSSSPKTLSIRGFLPRYFSSHWSLARISLVPGTCAVFREYPSSMDVAIYALSKTKILKLTLRDTKLAIDTIGNIT